MGNQTNGKKMELNQQKNNSLNNNRVEENKPIQQIKNNDGEINKPNKQKENPLNNNIIAEVNKQIINSVNITKDYNQTQIIGSLNDNKLLEIKNDNNKLIKEDKNKIMLDEKEINDSDKKSIYSMKTYNKDKNRNDFIFNYINLKNNRGSYKDLNYYRKIKETEPEQKRTPYINFQQNKKEKSRNQKNNQNKLINVDKSYQYNNQNKQLTGNKSYQFLKSNTLPVSDNVNKKFTKSKNIEDSKFYQFYNQKINHSFYQSNNQKNELNQNRQAADSKYDQFNNLKREKRETTNSKINKYKNNIKNISNCKNSKNQNLKQNIIVYQKRSNIFDHKENNSKIYVYNKQPLKKLNEEEMHHTVKISSNDYFSNVFQRIKKIQNEKLKISNIQFSFKNSITKKYFYIINKANSFSIIKNEKYKIYKENSFTILCKTKKNYQKELVKMLEILKKEKKFYQEKDFRDKEFLFEGGFTEIYSSFNIKDTQEVCLKKINIDKMVYEYKQRGFPEDSYERDLKNEIELLKLFSNKKNSVKYYGDYNIIKEKTIIMEKCDDDLEKFLKNRGKSFSADEIKNIFIDINEIFKIMQQKKIIHRDLKLTNFLVKYLDEEKSEFIIKLSDYGIGKFLNKANIFSGYKGTNEYMAPEMHLEKMKE